MRIPILKVRVALTGCREHDGPDCSGVDLVRK
jgi:hypothetical protein